MIDKACSSIHMRLWMLGTFRVERRVRDQPWQEVSQQEWGTNAHTRRLLQVPWCQGRTARRSTIIEAFLTATHYLRCRLVLPVAKRPPINMSLFIYCQ